MKTPLALDQTITALGLMSGTSLDGIDVALIETDGQSHLKRGTAATYPYDQATRRLLVQAIADARGLTCRMDRRGCLAEAEQALTLQHADAVAQFLKSNSIDATAVAVIGFHGQTVLHRPGNDAPLTVQLGDGQALSRATTCPVVFDMRAADVAAGGQGAPLVPVYHQALTAHIADKPIAVVNIGGVANVTYIGRDGHLLAFDTGPGNALIDDWMMKRAGTPRDEDGRSAAHGRVHEDVVRFYLSHSFFSEPPPKSLDRNAFFWDLVEGLSIDDGAATLSAFTAGAIAKSREHMPEEPKLWVVAGGGRRNRTIMTMIAERVHHAVVPAEAVHLDGDSLEAEAWGYLAVRSLKGLPLTFPGTTGVQSPLTGGVFARPPT